jgi:hypothetical protein
MCDFDFLSEWTPPALGESIAAQIEPVVAADVVAVNQALASANSACKLVSIKKERFKLKAEGVAGKCGLGRHGCERDRLLLGFAMRHARLVKRARNAHDAFLDLMKWVNPIVHRKKMMSVQDLYSKKQKMTKVRRSIKGNRHKQIHDTSWYLQHAFFGDKVIGVTKKAHSRMNVVVSMSVMLFQLRMLSKLAALMDRDNALAMVTRHKWDEATKECRILAMSRNPTKTRKSKLELSKDRFREASWQIMVSRISLIAIFQGGRSVRMNLVLPPTMIQNSSAKATPLKTAFKRPFKKAFKGLSNVFEMPKALKNL